VSKIGPQQHPRILPNRFRKGQLKAGAASNDMTHHPKQPSSSSSTSSSSKVRSRARSNVQSPYAGPNQSPYVQSRPISSGHAAPRRRRYSRQPKAHHQSTQQSTLQSVRLPRRKFGSPRAAPSTQPLPVIVDAVSDMQGVLDDIQSSTLKQQCDLLEFFTSAADQPQALVLNMTTCLIHSIVSRIQAWYRGQRLRRWKSVYDWQTWAATVIQLAWSNRELCDAIGGEGGRVARCDGTEYCRRVVHSNPAAAVGCGRCRVTVCDCREQQICDACTPR
jgi:hypothetical protein